MTGYFAHHRVRGRPITQCILLGHVDFATEAMETVRRAITEKHPVENLVGHEALQG